MAIDVTVRTLRMFLFLLFISGYLTPCKSMLTTDYIDVLRLPQSVLPEHYDLELQPIITEPDVFMFLGEVNITMQIRNATNNITLHVKDLTVYENTTKLISVEGDSSPPVVTGVTKNRNNQFYILQLNKALHSGHRYQLRLKFTGYLRYDLTGFYRSSYKDPSAKTRWLATTQFEPTGARRAFPCFDEPAMKATFNITLVRPENLTSLSNMPIYKSENRSNGWVADYFMRTVPMSTYLLAFIVSPFKGVGRPEFSVWTSEENLKFTGYALEIGPKVLKRYESFFNISYPLPKMDMVAIPDLPAEAMENWGIITYKESTLLYDKKHSSDADKQIIARTVAHELAHQWFGNLVTPKWWNDLWLNEGFATLVQYLGTNSIHPDWGTNLQFVISELQDVMQVDSLQSSHPVSVPLSYPAEILQLFDRISYAKGATVIRMVQNFLGEAAFQRGLCNYLNEHKYGNADKDDLWKQLTAAQEKYEIDIRKVMDYWTLNAGYPVVFIDTDASTGELTANQYRFLMGNENVNYSISNWPIPLTFTNSRNPNWSPTTKMWLNTPTGKTAYIVGPYDWIIANIQQVGYYRVNYSRRNWQLILRQLDRDFKKIHVINRAQIIDDSLNLARAGYLDYDVALDITSYLNQETEYLPWQAVMNAFDYLNAMISHDKIYDSLEKYFIKQIRPVYKQLGWEEIESENLLKRKLRILAITFMCSHGYKDCVRTAVQKFAEWRNNTQNFEIIPTNFRKIVYCTAIKQGGQEEWNYMWELYINERNPSQKDFYMSSLSCTTSNSMLIRLFNLDNTDDSGIREEDRSAAFSYVASKHNGRKLAFNYFIDNWDAIFNRFMNLGLTDDSRTRKQNGSAFFSHIASKHDGRKLTYTSLIDNWKAIFNRHKISALRNIVKSATAAVNTQLEINQLKQLYQKYREDVIIKRDLARSIEHAENNHKWMLTKFKRVKSWLLSLC